LWRTTFRISQWAKKRFQLERRVDRRRDDRHLSRSADENRRLVRSADRHRERHGGRRVPGAALEAENVVPEG
jgi:hypothetical protein